MLALVAATGSLSNTLVAISRLGAASKNNSALRIGLAGSVGSDALGDFYRSKMSKAGVSFVSAPVTDGADCEQNIDMKLQTRE